MHQLLSALENLLPELLLEQASVSSEEVTVGISKVWEADSLEQGFSVFLLLTTTRRGKHTHIRQS